MRTRSEVVLPARSSVSPLMPVPPTSKERVINDAGLVREADSSALPAGDLASHPNSSGRQSAQNKSQFAGPRPAQRWSVEKGKRAMWRARFRATVSRR